MSPSIDSRRRPRAPKPHRPSPLRRHLPAAAAVLLPLVVVAVLGGLELRRQAERAESAVEQQAITFLQAARLRFEEQIRGRALAALAAVELRTTSLVQETQRVIEAEDRVLDLFLLDASGRLLHPRLRDPNGPGRLLNTPPAHEDLRLAAHLEAMADDDRARAAAIALYRRFASDRRSGRGAGPLAGENARALFRLGTLLRRDGQLAAAEEAYTRARLTAGLQQRGGPEVDLLARLAIAEMRGADSELLDVAGEVADNEWYMLPDELLAAVVDRALAHVSDRETLAPRIAETRALERTRAAGRRFGLEYEALAAAAVSQQLLAGGQPPALLLRALGTGSDCALLAARPTADAERQRLGQGAAWLGLRLDLPALVNDVMDAYLTPREEGFRLEVLDPFGTSLLPGSEPAEGSAAGGAEPWRAAVLSTFAGLSLRAVPVAPEQRLAAQRTTLRNRTLLVVALCLLALGGGFVLVRSAVRETELATLKVDLVSRVSHELKTPLALLRLYGETLARGRARDAGQAAHFGSIVSRESDRLARTIERILDFSRQHAGTLGYSPRPTDVGSVCREVVDEFRPHAADQGAELTLELAGGDGAPLLAEVDPDGLRGSLVNLLENGVKYGGGGRVEVHVGRGGDGGVRVEVRDRGVGIPGPERERVFDSFYRASTAGEVRGTGLGLSLVRHFAEQHGGTATALARDGGGTVLRIDLPPAPRNGRAAEPTTT